MKKILPIIILAVIFSFAACTNESDGVNLTFKSENTMFTKKSVTINENVVITDFRLSIRDIEFKTNMSTSEIGEISFDGPFELDLLDETGALEQTIGNIVLTDGLYKALRFKLHKTTEWNSTSPLYDRSVYIAGTINNVPFEFWHDTSENLDIENANGIEVVDGAANIVVVFSIDQFFNSLNQIDLTLAVDEDLDGLIKINPDDDDGNGSIADDLKENIKMAADFIKE